LPWSDQNGEWTQGANDTPFVPPRKKWDDRRDDSDRSQGDYGQDDLVFGHGGAALDGFGRHQFHLGSYAIVGDRQVF
jgi:hypothetical protein